VYQWTIVPADHAPASAGVNSCWEHTMLSVDADGGVWYQCSCEAPFNMEEWQCMAGKL